MQDTYPSFPQKKYRRQGLQSISNLVEKVSTPFLESNGHLSYAFILSWRRIVGESLASQSIPLKVQFPLNQRSKGILIVIIYHSSYALEISYKKEAILEELNQKFGYNAVVQLQMLHKPRAYSYLSETIIPMLAASKEPSPEMIALWEKATLSIEDAALKDVLIRLGSSF